jgi:hypothetical protein
MAFAPNIGRPNANYMVANLFYRCSNLTTPATIMDTYKLPNTITDLSYFLYFTHSYNSGLTEPIDLSQLSGWFNNNTSIDNLTSFLVSTHFENTGLTEPIDLSPLSGWFNNNTSIAGLSGFLYQTHSRNTNLKLKGQIIFPNWIKTLTQDGTPIQSVSNAFYQTFYNSVDISGDTGEPKFEDGDVLSSLGQPSSNKNTYTNRSGITPVNSNWKQ